MTAALPRDVPLPEGWRHGPWVPLDGIPADAVVVQRGQCYSTAWDFGGSTTYGHTIQTDIAYPAEEDLTAGFFTSSRRSFGKTVAVRLLQREATR